MRFKLANHAMVFSLSYQGRRARRARRTPAVSGEQLDGPMTSLICLWVLVTLTIVCFAHATNNATDPLPQTTTRQYQHAFAQWMHQHQMAFDDPLEYAQRLQQFIVNDRFIVHHNRKHPHLVLAHNQFSYLSDQEFREQVLHGLKLPEGFFMHRRTNHTKNKPWTDSSRVNASELPEAIDWVQKGAVTPIKNQGMCGSCWAFSATGAVEGATFVSSGKLPSLSEQQLVDCDKSSFGCGGGNYDFAFKWMQQHGGLCSEQDYAYVAQDDVCRTCHEVVHVTGSMALESNDEQLMKETAAQQPVSVAIRADLPAFRFYKSGVFDLPCDPSMLNHAVLVVGYGADTNGKKYWKVKNSWGEGWGEQGYIRMAREMGDDMGQCGIAVMPSIAYASLNSKNPMQEWTRRQPATFIDDSWMEQVKNEEKAHPKHEDKSIATISQCGDMSKSIVVFDELTLDPKSPVRGKKFSGFGNGTARQPFDAAKVSLTVTLADTSVYSHDGTLCGDTRIRLPMGLGHIDVHGFSCPMEEGDFKDFSLDVTLPTIAPSGNYEIRLLGSSVQQEPQEDENLFCVLVKLRLFDDERANKSEVYEPLAVM